MRMISLLMKIIRVFDCDRHGQLGLQDVAFSYFRV
jgi:hypothetical protein